MYTRIQQSSISREWVFTKLSETAVDRPAFRVAPSTMAAGSSHKLTAEQEKEIHERVSFDIVLRQVKGNHTSFSDITFAGVPFGTRTAWTAELCEALAANTTVLRLNLTNTHLGDATLQKLVVTLASGACAPQLKALDLRSNPFSLAGETMAQGLRKLRPKVEVLLGEVGGAPAAEIDGFVHDKMLVEGLTAWGAEMLKTPEGGFNCPPEVAGEKPAHLDKGFSGANGTKYTCEHGEFQLIHTTGSMVLKKLSPEAALRLACKTSGAPAQGTLV